MNNQIKIYIGEYNIDLIINYKNIKNIIFRFKNSQLVVSSPYHTSINTILKIINSNEKKYIKFIESDRNKIILFNKKNDNLYCSYIFGIKTIISFDIDASLKKISAKWINDEMSIISYKKLSIKEVERLFLNNLLKKYENIFIKRLEIISSKMDIPLNNYKVLFRNTSSKWGSYNNYKKELCFSKKLLLLPIKFIDYIIIHELSHIFEQNHSNKFWKIVNYYCPSYKILRKKLNIYKVN